MYLSDRSPPRLSPSAAAPPPPARAAPLSRRRQTARTTPGSRSCFASYPSTLYFPLLTSYFLLLTCRKALINRLDERIGRSIDPVVIQRRLCGLHLRQCHPLLDQV